MRITCERIERDQKEVLANLLTYYVYDCSWFLKDFSLTADGGLAEFKQLERFFSVPYETYIIKVDAQIAGFVIVKRGTDNNRPLFIMEQFFVVKHFQGQRIGKKVAFQIFDQYSGKWRVQQKERNYPAQSFWRSVIKEYTNNVFVETYSKDRDTVQEFLSNIPPVVVFSSQQLIVKRLDLRDAHGLFSLINNDRKHLREWLPWVDHTRSVDDSASFIRENISQYISNQSFSAGIWLKGELVGTIGFHLINWTVRSVSIGYWLSSFFQGQGIMTTSVREMVSYGIRELKLNKIVIQVAPSNHRSCSIPERLGFKKEGCLRENEWLYDHFVDHNVYSVLAKDWN